MRRLIPLAALVAAGACAMSSATPADNSGVSPTGAPAGAASGQSGSPAAPGTNAVAPSPSQPVGTVPVGGPVTWNAALKPMSGFNVSGTAAVTPSATNAGGATGGQTATVTLTQGAAGAVYPWHVHKGTCSAQGPIVGAASDYPPLTVGSDGAANALARISTKLDQGQSYYVNIHKSATEMGTIVACGELAKVAM